MLSSCQSVQESKMPETWKNQLVFGQDAERVWSEVTKDGKVDVEEIIDIQYGLGSHHDGDRQFYTALTLAELNEDPYEYLNKMINSEDPLKRSFAALVVGELGDKRFYGKLKELLKDNTPVPGHFDDTVAKKAESALNKMKAGSETFGAASWLIKARNININK